MTRIEKMMKNPDKLTAKQRSIASYILSSPGEVCYLSLKELAKRTGASEVSVLRTCTALGFEGYAELKRALRNNASEMMRSYAQPAFLGADARTDSDKHRVLSSVCADDLRHLSDMIKELDYDLLLRCADRILRADQVYIFAHDASAIFSKYLAYRLNFLRVRANNIKLADNDMIQSVLARMKRQDFAILLSFPPYYMPIGNISSYCDHMGIATMAITDSVDSPAVTAKTSAFLCKTAARYFYTSHAATTSFINILSSCIAIQMGERFQEILDEEQDVSEYMESISNE